MWILNALTETEVWVRLNLSKLFLALPLRLNSAAAALAFMLNGEKVSEECSKPSMLAMSSKPLKVDWKASGGINL